jgi:hypothetical protein
MAKRKKDGYLRKRGISKKAGLSSPKAAFKLASGVRRGRFQKAPYYRGLANPELEVKLGKWVHARAVRFRKQAGRIVMDIKKHV